MKRDAIVKRNLSSLIGLALLCFATGEATPTSLFWTNCTTDVQAAGTLHANIDNFFRIVHPSKEIAAFPTDLGLTVGLFEWNNLKAEVGIDYLCGTHDPWWGNGKIGFGENLLFENAPSMSLGIFNVGTRWSGMHRTNQNIVHMCLGKTVPEPIGGRVFVGCFSGRRAMGKNRQGAMISFERPFWQSKDPSGTAKWALLADYASGKNTIGGGGVAIKYFVTPKCSLLTGPVWFNDRTLNGKWKWSVQVDFDL